LAVSQWVQDNTNSNHTHTHTSLPLQGNSAGQRGSLNYVF